MSDETRRKAGNGTDPSQGEQTRFLARWARRKPQARASVSAEPRVADNISETETSVAGSVPQDDSSETDTPAAASQARETSTVTAVAPLESLHADSDYSAFLSPEVSADLQRQALRKLFHAPKFNVRDPLDSEAGDFTKFEPLGGTITADMRQQMKRAARSLSPPPEKPVAGSQMGLQQDPTGGVSAGAAQPAPASPSGPIPGGEASHEDEHA